ncbi:MAG: carboxypeptidase regulatory-like domain-containing protein [Flavobacterium sp.]|nr:MAG: carboxypeptidase regulatory-like domain-containing protein [Flavobacterium sp.]
MKQEYGSFTITYIDGVTLYNYLGSKAMCLKNNTEFDQGNNKRADYIYSLPYIESKEVASKDFILQAKTNTINLAKAYIIDIAINCASPSDCINLCKNINGKSYFGVIRALVKNDYYFTSSDIFIFPKVGKTTVLPDEIVFVKTHNLNVLVKSDKNTKNQVVAPGNPLSNYPVQLLDQPKYFGKYNDGSPKPTVVTDEKDDLATMPWEANAEHYVGQTLYNLDPNSPAKDLEIVDIVKTNEFGIASFKNILNIHTHVPYLAVNPYEGNYNYKPLFGDLIVAGTAYSDGSFNSDFVPQTLTREIVAKPKLPEIYLRAIVKQAGLPKGIENADVHIITYTKAGAVVGDEYFKTDPNGYLLLSNLKENLDRTITIEKNGFSMKVVAKKQNIQLGERFPASVEQEMYAGGKVAGYVVNEKGQPISCNIRVADGPYIKTTNGVFQIQNVQSGWKSLEIAPTVDNYHGETLAPVIAASGWTVITNPAGNAKGTIVLKEKLHRVKFKVVDEDGKPVRSDIGVGGSEMSWYVNDPYTGLTDEIAFASPGTEFKVRVVQYGYVAYDDYIEIPVNKTAKIIPITLRKAQVISGVVKDAVTGKPVIGARVYTITGTNADGEVQNSTLTGTDGKYTLYGSISPQVWISFVQFYQNLPIKIYAVKSGTPGYVRSEMEVSANNPVANFLLSPITTKAEIWGLPIEVHMLARPNYYTTIISGAFIKLPKNNAFKLEYSDVKLPFKQMVVNATADGFVPKTDVIDIETSALKVMAYDKFACELIASDKENVFNKLSVKKSNGYGTIAGYLTSELSSFNFSYKYNGKFIIGYSYRLGNGGGIVNRPTDVFSAAPNFIRDDIYGLQPLYGKNSFALHNFTAKMMGGSKFSASGFKIVADVNLNIPLVGAQSMSAGTLNVSQNNIEWSQYTGTINLPLETWKITGSGLMYEINKGGFKVLDGSLKTDLPQVNLKDLMIMPTTIDLGLTELTGNEGLTLANVTPLKLMPGAMMTLNFDPASPFDQKPHYRLNLTGPAKTVAYINELPGMGASKVNINMLSTYSNGKNKTIIVEPTKVNYYNILSQEVSGIDVADNFFTLVGNTNLEIPGAPNNITGRFKYYKNIFDANADKNGNVLMIDKLQTDVEMEGKVKFEGTSFKISQNELVVDGNVYVYKNSLNDAIKGIRGQLTKRPNDIKMNFLPNQKIMMGSKSVDIISGGNTVQGNKWSLVNFVGQPNMVKQGEKDIFAPNQNQLDFIVNGAIANNPKGKQIQLSGINTPFGDLNVTFDFDNAIFNGTLVLKGAKIVLGPVTVNDGTIDLQIDKNGFIVVGAITNAAITAPLPSVLTGGFKSGIAMGYYKAALPNHLTKKLIDVTLYNQLPSSFSIGLVGFYVNVMKSLDKNALPQLPGPNLKDIPLIGAFVPVFDFSAGIDIYALVDFNEGVSIGGMAFANASCLYDLELCTIGLSGGATGKFDLKFPGKSLEGSLLFGIDARLSYCLGNLGVGAQLLLEKNGSGFTFKPSLK